jgi:carbamoyltransferase
LFSEHHLIHAASAFFSSPFKHAVILTLDGVGEWAATSAGMGDQNRITMLKEIHFPHSLGLLYSAFTYFRDSGLIRANARSWGLHLMVNPALLRLSSIT